MTYAQLQLFGKSNTYQIKAIGIAQFFSIIYGVDEDI